MISIKLDRGSKMVTVNSNDKLVSADVVSNEEFKELMGDLVMQTDIDIDYLRKITKMLKVSSFEFKGEFQ